MDGSTPEVEPIPEIQIIDISRDRDRLESPVDRSLNPNSLRYHIFPFRERMPTEEVPELGDFWNGTVLNLRRSFSVSSTSSDSSFSSDAIDMTEATMRRSQSRESGQNLPSQLSRQNSPSRESGQNSPSLESDQYSPSLESEQYSPSLESAQNSPLLDSAQNSPLHETGEHSPLLDSAQNSPLHETGEHSPLHETGEHSPLHETGERSPLHETGEHSPLHETGEHSPLHETGERSPLHETGEHSPLHEIGEHSPLHETGEHSPLHETGEHSPPHEPIRLTLRRVPRRSSASQESSPNSPLREDIYIAEPPAKIRKLRSPSPGDNDGETCPICLDTWGNSGSHRLVALKCGHLFGYKCVERWIHSYENRVGCCPTCKTQASIKDIRNVYANRLVAVDTTELTALQRKVREVQMERNQIQMELKSSQLEQRALALKLKVLREKLAIATGKQIPRRHWKFALDKNLEVWRDGGCRVLAYNCRTYEFYVSQKTTNSLFPGYGVRSVSCVDYKLGPFIPLHPKAIRDVAYSQKTDLLMSVGLDGAVKIVERGIPTTSIQCKMPLWSCTWDHTRPNSFYVGAVGGLIMMYDVRNTSAIMNTINLEGDMSPSVELVSTEFGLLSCQLNSAWLCKNTVTGMRPELLPLRGPFVSLCYDQESKHVAVSCRPTQSERAKIVMYKVNRSPSNNISFDEVGNLYGSFRSTVMSRAAFVKCAESSWVASYSESDSALLLHSLDGGRAISLPAADPALDVCAGVVNSETYLAALSNSRMRLYKSYPTSSHR